MPSSRKYEVHMVSFKSEAKDGYNCVMGLDNLTKAHIEALEEYLQKVKNVIEAWGIEEIEAKIAKLKTEEPHPGEAFA